MPKSSSSTLPTGIIQSLSPDNQQEMGSESDATSTSRSLQPRTISPSNNMNSRINKRMKDLPDNLKLHGTTPSGKPRLFVCDVCSRAFARQEHLDRHARSHTNEKPYQCGICTKKFTRRDLLLRHAQKVHNGNCGETIQRKKRQKTMKPKRRASFSAQSAKHYANANINNFGIPNSVNKVEFSTPVLLPLDFKFDEEGFQFFDSENINLDGNSMTDNLPPLEHHNLTNAHHLVPTEFSLLDSKNWINDYNNNNVNPLSSNTESNSTSNTTPLNSKDDPIILNSGTSSWSLNQANGELKVKSLFDGNSVIVLRENEDTTESFDQQLNDIDSNKIQNPVYDISPPIFQSPSSFDKSPFFEGLFDSGLTADYLLDSNPHPDALEFNFKNILQEGLELNSRNTNSETPFQPLSMINENSIIPDGTHMKMQDLNIEIPQPTSLVNNNENLLHYSMLPEATLFSQKMHEMCSFVLSYYSQKCIFQPHNNETNESQKLSLKELFLPDFNELNQLLVLFQENFISHYPFIHTDLLNADLESLKKYVAANTTTDNAQTSPKDVLQYSKLVCLPLFMCTFGSLYKYGCNSKTIELYEISRRVLHVYLEINKKIQDKPAIEKHSQHVWLIQSLMLSIVFAMLADSHHKIDADLLKRQITAICAIIRANFLNDISLTQNRNANELNFNSSFEHIMFESKIRCTLMVYRFCQFLNIFFGINSILFLNEDDVKSICIPDDENTWRSASLFPQRITGVDQTVKKQHSITFKQFYEGFIFNDAGLYPIPETLAIPMLYYEFAVSKTSNFHIFLTKIDTRKLETNLSQSLTTATSESSMMDIDELPLSRKNYSSMLKHDSTISKNCLMTMLFFNDIDSKFGSKIWAGKTDEIFDQFLSANNLNLLTKGSYSLLTNFLVALNFSIQNISSLISICNSGTTLKLNNDRFSLFNIQGYFYNFLIVLKFLLDFEATPNFKLLCIFTELKKLADNILIPKLYTMYPQLFEKLGTEWKTKQKLNNPPTFTPINIERLEKLIDNVLVCAFNDTSFLTMSKPTTNEFLFHDETYSKADESINSPSSVDLVNYHSTVKKGNRSQHKQTLESRYHLSTKYVLIAECLLNHATQKYEHCYLLEKMVKSFAKIEKLLENENNQDNLSKLKIHCPVTLKTQKV